MKRVLIDTNAYSALMRGESHIADVLMDCDVVLVSPIVEGELYDGFLGGSRNKENLAIFNRFLEKPKTVRVPVTYQTSEWFAEIKRMLRKKGAPIPINDVWIAASCMEHGARLLTQDEYFKSVDGLLRIGER
ncbi:MAG TPA: VapC toxin family PIN domain ribonuclease [Spirochaeta sp.]|nr:VapC toxin family PIN domain ribonuclease [Spirochaeta sp.]